MRIQQKYWVGVIVLMAGVGLAVVGTKVLGRQEQQGWLVLRGELIPGPYVVEVAGDDVLVNGRGLKQPPPQSDIFVTEHTNRKAELLRRFAAEYQVWLGQHGEKVAKQKALEFWQSQAIVSNAYFDPETDERICVLYRGEKYETGIMLSPFVTPGTPEPTEESRREYLRQFAEGIQSALLGGNLIIVEGLGRTHTVSREAGREKLELFAEIIRSNQDIDARIAALRERAGLSADMARSIAERYNK